MTKRKPHAAKSSGNYWVDVGMVVLLIGLLGWLLADWSVKTWPVPTHPSCSCTDCDCN
jgi:hypothetical protein